MKVELGKNQIIDRASNSSRRPTPIGEALSRNGAGAGIRTFDLTGI
jgi:hypothetical protein